MAEKLNQPQAVTGEKEYQYLIDSIVTPDQILTSRQVRMAIGGLDPSTETEHSGDTNVKRIPVRSLEPDPKELIYDDGYIQRILDYYGSSLQQIFPRTCAIQTQERKRQLQWLKAVIKGEKEVPRELLTKIRRTIADGCRTWEANQVHE